MVDFYSQPQEYLIDTIHLLNDKVYVYEKWTVSEDNGAENVTGIGFVLEDENTLERNDFTRYIYVEDAQ